MTITLATKGGVKVATFPRLQLSIYVYYCDDGLQLVLPYI